MARESTIQILYGGTTTGSPTDLSDGELAYAHGSKNLFVGANGDNTSVWVGAEILDEDTMSSNSNTSLATQQSIKTYVDNSIAASSSGVSSVAGLSGDILVDGTRGVTVASAGDTITVSGITATYTDLGVARFNSNKFTVTNGLVTVKTGGISNSDLEKGYVFGITADGGLTDLLSVELGSTLDVAGGNSIETSISTVSGIPTISVGVSNLGIDTAQLATGAVVKTKIGADAVDGTKIEDDAIDSEHIVDGAVDNVHLANSTITMQADSGSAQSVALGKNIDISGGTNINTSVALGFDPVQANVTVNLDDNVSLSGGLTAGTFLSAADLYVSNGIANTELQNSSITVQGPNDSTAVSLGGTIGFTGTANEVEVSESAGTITIGLPDDVTITGNLTVSGTVTTLDVNNVSIEDPLIELGKGNTGDALDLGFYAQYFSGGPRFAGLARNASVTDADGNAEFFLFTAATSKPSTTISDTPTLATIRAKITGGTYT